jgi:MFS family permease
LPLTIAVVAPFSGALADRIGSRWLAAGGLALASVGLLLLTRLDADSTLEQIVGCLGCLMLTGLGQGMFQSPNTRAFMNAAPAGQQGEASGLLATGRVVGQSLSVALAAAIFTSLGGASAGLTLAAARDGAVAPTHVIALQHTFLEAQSRVPRAVRGQDRGLSVAGNASGREHPLVRRLAHGLIQRRRRGAGRLLGVRHCHPE